MTFDFSEFKTPIPAIQGHFGKRLLTYTTQLTPTRVQNLLGHDPRSAKRKALKASNPKVASIYDAIQRPTTKDRREGVAGYITQRIGPQSKGIGAFPAISIGCTRPEEFRAFQGTTYAGLLLLDTAMNSACQRILLDGLGRYTGAMDLAESGHADDLDFDFPVTIFTPMPDEILSVEELGQLFADMNGRVHPVPQRLSLRLETVDPYVRFARDLAEEPFIAEHGGVAEGAASLGGKSTQLVVQSVFLRAVRGACEGRQFQLSGLDKPEMPNLTEANSDELRDAIAFFFNNVADYMGDEKWEDRDSLHLTSPGWQTLGIIAHDLIFRMEGADIAAVAEKVAAIDWSRTNPDWFDLDIGQPETDKVSGAEVLDAQKRRRIVLTVRGRTSADAILAYVRAKAGLEHLTNEDAD